MERNRYFSNTDYKRKMRVNQMPVVTFYVIVMLLANLSNYLYTTQISAFLKCPPSWLLEYI